MPKPSKNPKSSAAKRRQPKNSEHKIKTILESLSEMVFEADKLGNIVYANRIALETLGYKQVDLDKGVNILDLVAREDVDKASASLFRFSGGDHPQEELGLEEYTIKKADGTKLPIAIHINRILNSKGNITGFRGILFNTTESKQFKAALQKSEEKLRFILNSISDGIIVTDLEGKIVEAVGIETKEKRADIEYKGQHFSLSVSPNAVYSYKGRFHKTKSTEFSI